VRARDAQSELSWYALLYAGYLLAIAALLMATVVSRSSFPARVALVLTGLVIVGRTLLRWSSKPTGGRWTGTAIASVRVMQLVVAVVAIVMAFRI